MRNLIIAATAAAAVGFVLPAAAQNSGQWNGGESHQGQMLQQKIQQDLSQAGFTDIHVMPRSFVVSAKDREGNPVQMMITPHSVTALTAMPRHNQYGQNGNGWNDNRGNNGYSQNGSMDNGQSYRQSQNGMMGDNGMSDSAHSGNMMNSPNGNGSYSR